jgi:hypothetical protein
MFLGFIRDYSIEELLASSKTHWAAELAIFSELSDAEIRKCLKLIFELEKNSDLSQVKVDTLTQVVVDQTIYQAIDLGNGTRFALVWQHNERVGHRTSKYKFLR